MAAGRHKDKSHDGRGRSAVESISSLPTARPRHGTCLGARGAWLSVEPESHMMITLSLGPGPNSLSWPGYNLLRLLAAPGNAWTRFRAFSCQGTSLLSSS